MAKNFDCLSIGNINVDIFITLNQKSDKITLDKKKDLLSFAFGEKIDVDKSDISLGGNACNAAVGIARLELESGLMSEMGEDGFTEKIQDTLSDENVDQSLISKNKEEETSVSIVINYGEERTILVEHQNRKNDFKFDSINTKLVYLTSLGSEWENIYRETIDFVKENNIKLAFNPGTLQIEKMGETVLSVLSKSDLLFVNKEEAEELLYGRRLSPPKHEDDYIKKLLFELKDFGAKTVIITDGENGSFACDEHYHTYHLGILKSQFVEKTGAGDAYTSGFISANLLDLPLNESMRWGALNSSSVVEKVGAQQGLLNKEEMEHKLSLHQDFQAREL